MEDTCFSGTAAIWDQATSSLCAYFWTKERTGQKQASPPHPPAAGQSRLRRPAPAQLVGVGQAWGSTPASCTAAWVSQTLRPGTERTSRWASWWLSPPRCYVGLRRAPLPAAQWLLCAQNLHLSPHGLEQKSPLWSPQGPERKLGGQSQQPRPPCLVSLWFTLVSSPSLDSRCGSGEVVLEMGTVGN